MVDGEVTVQAALVIGKGERKPAPHLVKELAGDLHQTGGFDGEGGLIGGLPLLVDDGVGQLRAQLLDVVATDAILDGDGHAVLTLCSQMCNSEKRRMKAVMA